MTIQPFGFDRIFRFDTNEPVVDEGRHDALREHVEELQARIERLHEDHVAELARARVDGFEAGLEQARGERAEAMLAATDALHASIDDVERRFDAVMDQVVAEAGAIALQAAELLAGHVIAAHPARAIDEALTRALDQVSRDTALAIRANPAMREDIERLVEERRARERRSMSIVVVDDDSLPLGDAHIGWAEGGLNVDAGARRAAVLAELAGVLAPQTGDRSGQEAGE
ncbi:MAG: flagellar biosynthesis protein [Novosphingobium lindaniclasticum]|uniref:FliH/SctL family protein n=1 Tax=Novosphingobium lindaniclasticum TaxID=1329895 RepID=UPI00240A9BE5|nr:flagellar biosynthesis protein [Novosphingobium lindaniclasticum]MDF2637931.1 flagellar biosynthesis protein [Novosphingobium lindaniclasticum]